MMDATGSMSPHIERVKSDIDEIVQKIKEHYPETALRVGVVAYRDHYNDAKGERLELLNFVDYDSDAGKEAFHNFLGSLRAIRNYDAAEDVFGGLHAVGTRMPWVRPVRVLIHMGDAPCRGSSYHNGVSDKDAHLNEADRNGLKAADLLCRLQELNVDYTFGYLNNSTDLMVQRFREQSGCSNFPLQVDCSSVDKITRAVSRTVSERISSSVIPTRTRSILHAAPAPDVMSDLPVNWDAIEAFVYASESCQLPTSMSQACQERALLHSPLTLVDVKRVPHPFAFGAERLAYRAVEVSEARLGPPRSLVVKEFRGAFNGTGAARRELEGGLASSAIAEFLTQSFNSKLPSGKPHIHYVQPRIISSVSRGGSAVLPRFLYMSLEDELKGTWTRWTNNFGYVRSRDGDEECELLEAYSHFTYDITGGYLLVCDLQGIRDASGNRDFWLSDPAIHCTDYDDGRFGKTDFGEGGIAEFFPRHRCGAICRELHLPGPPRL